MAKKQAKAP